MSPTQGEILSGSPRLLTEVEWRQRGGAPSFTFLSTATHPYQHPSPHTDPNAIPPTVTPTPSPTPTPTPTRLPGTTTKIVGDRPAGEVALAFTAAEADEVDLTGVTLTLVGPVSGAWVAAVRSNVSPAGAAALPGGKVVYSYLDIREENLPSGVLGGVALEFQVRRSWVEENLLDKSKVVLLRLSRGLWDSLETLLQREDARYLYYRATSPGLSCFAIAGEPLPPTPTPLQQRAFELLGVALT